MTHRSTRYVLAGVIGTLAWLALAGPSPLAAQEGLGRGRVTGTVADEKGQPLADVSLVAQSLTVANAKLESVSDAKGRFALAGFGTGGWRITAAKAGYESASVDISVRQLVANPPLNLILKRTTGVAAFLQDKASSELFDQGSRLLDEGKSDEAIKIFEEILARYPEIYQIRLNIGFANLKKGDLDKAAAEFQGILDKTLQTHGSLERDIPTATRALSGLGETALKKGDLEAGQKYFAQALGLAPQDEVAAYNVGEIYFSHGQVDEAIRYLELAAKIKNDWPKVRYKLGVVYLNKGEYAKSLENLNAFLRMAPDDPEAAQAKDMIAAIEKIKK